jgi:hypothetical protein
MSKRWNRDLEALGAAILEEKSAQNPALHAWADTPDILLRQIESYARHRTARTDLDLVVFGRTLTGTEVSQVLTAENKPQAARTLYTQKINLLD